MLSLHVQFCNMYLFRKSAVNMEIRLYNKVHDLKKFENGGVKILSITTRRLFSGRIYVMMTTSRSY